jgi:hypothetical protein
MYGLPDSFIVGTVKRFRPKRRGGGNRGYSRRPYRPNLEFKVKTTFTYKFGGLRFREGALARELYTPSGGLWAYLERKGEAAEMGAKRRVGVKTGTLRNSIHRRHEGVFGGAMAGQIMKIGSWSVPYALAHHEGTKPHWITPKNNEMLSFTNKRGGRVFATAVYHPGTKPNPYLSRQLYHFRGRKEVPAYALKRPIPKGLS